MNVLWKIKINTFKCGLVWLVLKFWNLQEVVEFLVAGAAGGLKEKKKEKNNPVFFQHEPTSFWSSLVESANLNLNLERRVPIIFLKVSFNSYIKTIYGNQYLVEQTISTNCLIKYNLEYKIYMKLCSHFFFAWLFSNQRVEHTIYKICRLKSIF